MRSTLAALGLLVFSVSATAQGWANKLFQGKTTHDFGTVPRGTQLHHRFRITNIYAVNMEITNVRVSCGCASAQVGKRSLKPKEETYLDVNMDGLRFNGFKRLSIFVSVGPKFVSTAEIKISATTRGDIVCNPTHVDFGIIAPNQRISKSIDIEYAGRLDWKIQEVITRGTPFEVQVEQLYRRRGQIGYRLKVSLKSDVKAGLLKDAFQVRTNDATSPTFPVLVEANVQAALMVAPDRLSLGTVNKGTVIEKRLLVRGKVPFRIQKIDGTGEEIRVIEILPNRTGTLHNVKLRIRLNEPGRIRRDLTIQTDTLRTPVKVLFEADVQ